METLNPRVRYVWFVAAAVVAVLLGAAAWAVDQFLVVLTDLLAPAVVAVVVLVGGAYVVQKYRVWQFEIREDDLSLERGVFTRVKTVVPFVRVQHVDTHRGPIERAVGLASVVVYTAGSRGADVTIPGLTPERAAAIQEELRRLAIESESEDAV